MDYQDTASNFLEPIAIIGAGCRFASEATTPSKLWELLTNLHDARSRVPLSRYNPDGFLGSNDKIHGVTNVDSGYFLSDDINLFDNTFFGIRAQEAEAMDPQQRQLLEVVYEAIDSSGCSIQRLAGSDTAVFVGQMYSDFVDTVVRDMDTAPEYAATGTSRSIMSNRVSYFFDWKGPSMTIDTACSSSLVAVHQAVQSLRRKETHMAIAAGVNLILGPEQVIFGSQMKMLSVTGQCRMWDADANGYARGDGFAAVVMKTLSQALADGDDIECIIRETGVNQDGRSMGITMPNAESQIELIQSTYKRCGLNSHSEEGRCQYFEAHGTGTPAGDPVEARAIHTAFFSESTDGTHLPFEDSSQSPLLVGSVKTVIGHTEGTAGLAGLLKTSLAIQHGIIPANMHFKRLNPNVAPFYKRLQIPTSPKSWPMLPQGTPRRASVNSFGFGGTNCHVIVESWSGTLTQDADTRSTSLTACGPIVVSAHSRTSLKRAVLNLSELFMKDCVGDLDDIAWTLQCRRSEFPFKASFAATSIEKLRILLDDWLQRHANEQDLVSIKRSQHVSKSLSAQGIPGLLGIFTGQGAQWAGMGAILFKKSALFRNSIRSSEYSLKVLNSKAPLWSLEEELLAPTDASRVNEAVISQPLCTAVQVALIDLLSAAGVKFAKVIGHSSGEIAAAYAAGYLSANDAVRIAYFRGVCAQSAAGKGAMLAADMSSDEARNFCQQPAFEGGKLVLAASNAPSSVTLSGDAEAVTTAQKVLSEDNGVFARTLKVDTAYHSPHMNLCASDYLLSLRQCEVQIMTPEAANCTWYSSVHPGKPIEPQSLAGSYWIDNMVQPVLFSQALEAALSDIKSAKEKLRDTAAMDITAIEIGPHPALKRPASQTAEACGITLDYHGLLRRGTNDMEAFSTTLGNLWTCFTGSKPLVDFACFRVACIGEQLIRHPRVYKKLPPYAWEYERPLWRESRISKSYRNRRIRPHPLLGSCISYSPKESRWRSIMRVKELVWLRGHQFQGQILFPAQGYVSMVIDACMALIEGKKPAIMVEMTNAAIHRAMTFDEESGLGLEVLTVARIVKSELNTLSADFTISSASAEYIAGKVHDIDTHDNFTCRVVITMASTETHDDSSPLLPVRSEHHQVLSSMSVPDFYSLTQSKGFSYTQDFTAKEVQFANGLGAVRYERRYQDQIHVHPATLDVATQGAFAALSMNPVFKSCGNCLPVAIDNIRVDIQRMLQMQPVSTNLLQESDLLLAECHLRQVSSSQIVCDVDIFDAEGAQTEIQMQGLTFSVLRDPNQPDHGPVFSYTAWEPDISSGLSFNQQDAEMGRMLYALENFKKKDVIYRIMYFHMCRLRESVKDARDIPPHQPHLVRFWEWIIKEAIPRIEKEVRPEMDIKSLADSGDMIASITNDSSIYKDVEIVAAVGECLTDIIRGQVDPLQVLTKNNILNSWYETGQDCELAHYKVASAVMQIAHRYPATNILEIGAGAGAATVAILQKLKGNFASFTITDRSIVSLDGSREKIISLQEVLNRHQTEDGFQVTKPELDFRVLDIAQDPASQGFLEYGYDILIVSKALHETPLLAESLQNCRRLLRPGGYLILVENTASFPLLSHFVCGGLSNWWLDDNNRDEARTSSRLVGQSTWKALLLESGFYNIDTAMSALEYNDNRQDDESPTRHTVFVGQATDQRINLLREPLLSMPDSNLDRTLGTVSHVLIIDSSKSHSVSSLARDVRQLLQNFAERVDILNHIDDLETKFPVDAAVLSLAETHEPLFSDMTQTRFSAMREILCNASHVLWLSCGGCGDVCTTARENPQYGQTQVSPLASMVLGIVRSLLSEIPNRPLQFVGTNASDPPSARHIASMFLSFIYLHSQTTFENQHTEGTPLWSKETELAIDGRGNIFLPRIKFDVERNDRLNPLPRTHLWDENFSGNGRQILRLEPSKDGSQLHGLISRQVIPPLDPRFGQHKQLEVSVRYSSLCSLRLLDVESPLYICVGQERLSRKWVVTLTPHNTSALSTTLDKIIYCPEIISDCFTVQNVFNELLAENILQEANGRRIWIHGGSNSLAQTLKQKTLAHESSPLFTTSDLKSIGSTQLFIHPKTTSRQLEAFIPDDIEFCRCIVSAGHDNADMLIPTLQDHGIDSGYSTTFTNGQWITTLNFSYAEVLQLILGYVNGMQIEHAPCNQRKGLRSENLSIGSILSGENTSRSISPLSSVDWSCRIPTDIIARTDALSPSQLFSPHKTYVFAGLTRSAGLSICNFMADHGARYFALLSRSPDIPVAEKSRLRRKGVVWKTFAVDISDRDALAGVRDALNDPNSTLPSSIGGVANGAMALCDKAFAHYTLEEFEVALRPKVQGTQNLDALFGTPEAAPFLDFFVVLSSTSSINGAPGLSNYNAANLFMMEHIRQRRQRGLPASTMDISILADSGYLARNGIGLGSFSDATTLADRYHASLMNNEHLHCLFVEAVFSGRDDTGLTAHSQIHMGIRSWSHDTVIEASRRDRMPTWYNQPRFSHLRSRRSTDRQMSKRENLVLNANKATQNMSIQNQIISAGGPRQTLLVLEQVVSRRLEDILQMPKGTLDLDLPLLTLGIDSLVSTQVRLWLLKEVGVEMTIMQILSSPSTKQLCGTIQENLSLANPSTPIKHVQKSASSSDDEMMRSSRSQSTSRSSVSSSRFKTNCSSVEVTSEVDSLDSQDIPDAKDDFKTTHVSETPEVVRFGEMSHGQNRLFFMHSYVKDKSTFNCSGAGIIRGFVDIRKLETALQRLSKRHESLRSSFLLDEHSKKPMQVVKDSARSMLVHKQVEGSLDYEQELRRAMQSPLDIEKGEAVKIILLSESQDLHYLIILFHHIVMDGVSISIFMQEMRLMYLDQDPPQPTTQAIDASLTQRAKCTPAVREQELQFWTDVYTNASRVGPLPLFPFSKVQRRRHFGDYKPQSSNVRLGASFARKVLASCIRRTSEQQAVTPFQFYLAALAAFLSRWLHVSDLSIGITDSNRDDDAAAVGYFLNPLSLRFTSADGLQGDSDSANSIRAHRTNGSFGELLVAAREKLMAALAHSATPFDDVIDHLDIKRSEKYHPLFQAALNYRVLGRGSACEQWGDGCVVEWTDVGVAQNPFDIYIDITTVGGDEDVWINFNMRNDLYEASDVELLCQSFVVALESLVEPVVDDDIRIQDIPVVHNAWKLKTLELGTGPTVSLHSWPETLIHQINVVSTTYGSDTAIKEESDRSLTYEALRLRMEQLAYCLQNCNISNGSIVAVYLPPSAETLCFMLAIMRLGGIYVPLDRRSPLDRLSLIVDDCQPQAIIHNENDLDFAQTLGKRAGECLLINIDDPSYRIGDECSTITPLRMTHIACTAGEVAAIIYTSGSTGRPKGVRITHRNLLCQSIAVKHAIDIHREVVLQQSSLGFDCSMEQIFVGLAYGGVLVIVPEASRGDPSAIADIIEKEKVTYTVGVPSEYAALLRYGSTRLQTCQNWRIAVSGGEILTATHVSLFRNLNLESLQLVNAYGPAEATVSCTRGVVDYFDNAANPIRDNPHVGHVMANYTVTIVDDQINPVPVGCPGEICIGGPGVTLGYLGRPEETADRFITNAPFEATLNSRGGDEKFYRTGDFGRMMPDGTLKYISRVKGDTQIQVNGVRIELEEVASAIIQTAGLGVISDAAVSLRDQNQIIAFVVFSPSFTSDKQQFLDYLFERLPLTQTTRPSIMVPVENLPITQNGKRDQSAIDALPIPRSHSSDDVSQCCMETQELTEFESQIVSVWQEVLPSNIPTTLKKDTDFFRVGGNSMLLLRLQSVLRNLFMVNIPLPELFRGSSVQSMAATLHQAIQGLECSDTTNSIEWAREIASLADGISATPSWLTPPQSGQAERMSDSSTSSGLQVLLTGATGFLGSRILSILTADSLVARIHCVAVRPSNNYDIKRRVPFCSNNKITEYPGDLGSTNLGLSLETFSRLANCVDLIIHNGADVSFMKPYAALRATNVLSTRTLIEMALPRSIPVHFVSTANVAVVRELGSVLEGYESIHATQVVGPETLVDYEPKNDVDGYTMSKWASEALLVKCNAEHDEFCATIHRPTTIMGDSTPDTDWVGNLVRFSRILKAAPKLDKSITGALNLINLDIVAKDITQAAIKSSVVKWATPKRGVNVIHHCDENNIPPANFTSYLAQCYNIDMKEYEAVEWLSKAKALGMNEVLADFLNTWWTNGHSISLPMICKHV